MPPLAGLDRIAVATSTASLLHMMHSSGVPYQVLSNDLRLRVLAGEDISAEEMLLIVNDIRAGRRAAARPEKVTAARSRKLPATTVEDLRSIVDQELG